MITLTNDQQKAYDSFLAFLENDQNLFVLAGKGGVGKTKLTRDFASALHNTNILCGISPTHKAKNVLSNTLNKGAVKQIAVLTIASLLGKLKDHSYIGTHKYSNPVEKKLASYDIFILDEVSMVADRDLKFLIHYVTITKKKLVMIGDPYQIPCPSQHLVVKSDNMCYKEDSMAFKLDCIHELTEIVRQAKGSPIIAIANLIREYINEDIDILGELKLPNQTDFITSYLSNIKLYPHTTRCITYTNDGVMEYNRLIRRNLNYRQPYVMNEIMLAYTTIGFPQPYIINGSDYLITSILSTNNHIISHGSTKICCIGHLIRLKNLVTNHLTPTLFFISVDQNPQLMSVLVKLAEKVNANKSTKEDYKRYKHLKDQVIVCEDIYKYDEQIYTKSQFKEVHPLLFSKTTDVLNTIITKSETVDIAAVAYDIKDNNLTKKLKENYPALLPTRKEDNKPLDESESLCDQFMIIEKDLDYGYALTSHKSQASTYDVVYVDYQDFNKINNRWNFKHQCMENRSKEKNQLLYVAVSRARHELHVI